MSDTKEPKKRTPRTAESITAGALSLPLKERIAHCKAVAKSITDEVQAKENDAKEAKELANGLNGGSLTR